MQCNYNCAEWTMIKRPYLIRDIFLATLSKWSLTILFMNNIDEKSLLGLVSNREYTLFAVVFFGPSPSFVSLHWQALYTFYTEIRKTKRDVLKVLWYLESLTVATYKTTAKKVWGLLPINTKFPLRDWSCPVQACPFKQGDFFYFPMYCIQHCFICRPSDSTVSEDAGIDYCDFGIGSQSDALTTRLDLIHLSTLG